MKTIRQQALLLALRWPQFEEVVLSDDFAIWEGWLAGNERKYRVRVTYGTPYIGATALYRAFPVVQIREPELVPNPRAVEEAPLPHVYLMRNDIPRSPLCLFDPDAGEWNADDFIALTTIPWASDWLACYEAWRATGRWYGGGRHDDGLELRNVS